MKGMPLTFEDFQGKGGLDFCSSSSSLSSADFLPQYKYQQFIEQWQPRIDNREELCCYLQSGFNNIVEPRSVLEASRRSSPPNSSSTLSSSQGPVFTTAGGSATFTDTAGTTTTGLATTPAVNAASSCNPGSVGKCGQPHFHGLQLAMEDWEGVLSAGGGGSSSPSQEQSILRLIMADMEDPSIGLNKLLQTSSGATAEFGNVGCFGMPDQVFNFEQIANSSSSLPVNASSSSPDFPTLGRIESLMNQIPVGFAGGGFLPDEKPQILNPNQTQLTQLVQLPYPHLQEHHHHHLHLLSPPPPKRVHSSAAGGAFPPAHLPKLEFSDARSELYHPKPLQIHQKPVGIINNRPFHLQNQQNLVDMIYHAAHVMELNQPENAQGILARLNHQLPALMGKPLQRVAFYFKEALKQLLHSNNQPNTPSLNLVFKIAAYKSFSEISPIIQFANFTSNQAFLDSFEGFNMIHIVDFDLGFGDQWTSLMQELALRNGVSPTLKITAVSSPFHDELELGFTQDNLQIFARAISLSFELEIVRIDPLNPTNLKGIRVQEKEFLAVNLPIVSFIKTSPFLPNVVHYVKSLSPKIVVSLDRTCDRNDLNFPNHINQSLQSFTLLLESLDSCNMNSDAVQKIERFLIQPTIEKSVMNRHRVIDQFPSWRNMFLQQGFCPVMFSNFAESQADCLVQRTPVRGFQVEKKQSSLVLSWQRKELISVSIWKC